MKASDLGLNDLCDIISWVVAKLQKQQPNPLMETSEGSYHTFLSAALQMIYVLFCYL